MAHFPFNVDGFGVQATGPQDQGGLGVEWRHFYPHLSVRPYPPGEMYRSCGNGQPPTPVSRTLRRVKARRLLRSARVHVYMYMHV